MDDILRAARFDESRRYRYALKRDWSDLFATGEKTVAWVMLNPSVADEDEDDPTVRRCMGFSKAWRYDALVVVNLFALVSTCPVALRVEGADPVGPRNNEAIVRACEFSALTVCAWGKHGAFLDRGRAVREMLARKGIALHHLGLNDDASPRHPLYLPSTLTPIEWRF